METVRILTFIQEISDTLCEVLNDYTTQLNNEDDRPTKARIISHYKFLKDAGRSLNEGILNNSKLQKQKLIISSLISESKAKHNLRVKKENILNNDRNTKKNEHYLKHLMKSFYIELKKVGLGVKCERRISSGASISPNSTTKFPKPKNNLYYTLYEMMKNIDESDMTINKFYKDAVNEKPPIILYSLKTLYRDWNV